MASKGSVLVGYNELCGRAVGVFQSRQRHGGDYYNRARVYRFRHSLCGAICGSPHAVADTDGPYSNIALSAGGFLEQGRDVVCTHPWIVKLLLFLLTIQCVVELRSSDVMPFIYFQF